MADTAKPRAGTLAATAAGLACVLAWTYVVFFSRLVHYSTRNSIEHLNSTYAFACCGMVAAFFGAAALIRMRDRRGGCTGGAGATWTRLLPGGAACVLFVTTAVLAMVERKVFMQPWCSIASVLSGCAVAVLFLAWAHRLSGLRRTSLTVGCLVGAFVGAAALFVAVLYLPSPAGICVCSLLAPASAALFYLGGRAVQPNGDERPTAEGGWAPEARLPHADGAQPTQTCRASDAPPMRGSRAQLGPDGDAAARTAVDHEAMPTGLLVRTFACIGVLGLAESFMRALFLNVDPASDSVSYRWLFLLATALSAGFLALAATRSTKSGAVRLACRASMCALAFLTLLAPIVEDAGLAADLTTLVCHCMFYLLVWLYLSLTASAYPMPAAQLFGLGLGAAYLGCLAGTFFGGVLASFASLGYRMQSLVALLCAVAIVVAFLFIADEEVFARLIDADEERPQAPRRFMLRVMAVAQEYGLTPKETEVLTLAAKGRTTQRIREELGLSTGTVNTHLAHIYKKLDVHDRQQMLDLVEGRTE